MDNRAFCALFSPKQVNNMTERFIDNMLDTKSDGELYRSLLAEVAKASNELKCAKSDLDKAASRLNFLLVVTNKLIDRQKD